MNGLLLHRLTDDDLVSFLAKCDPLLVGWPGHFRFVGQPGVWIISKDAVISQPHYHIHISAARIQQTYRPQDEGKVSHNCSRRADSGKAFDETRTYFIGGVECHGSLA
jgi:hypothetical protein